MRGRSGQFLFLVMLVLLVFGLGTRIVSAAPAQQEEAGRGAEAPELAEGSKGAEASGQAEGSRGAEAPEQAGVSTEAGAEAETRQSAEEIREAASDALLSEFDLDEIDESLREMFPEGKTTFSEILSAFLSGDLGQTGRALLDFLADQISYEFRYNRHNLVYILLIALAAAVFTNFAEAFRSSQISEISFYILYMLLITLCLASFRAAVEGVGGRLDGLLDFMRVLCPAYFLAVAFASGSATSMFFYNMILFLIYAVELLIIRFLLPVINIYIMVRVMGSLTGEDFLSEFADLIKKAAVWCMRALLAGVVGVNVVQGLLGPAIDSLKQSALTRTAEALPWVGNVIGSTAEIFLGTTVLVKNGIGVAGAAAAAAVCAVPILQTALLALMYKLAAALVQPVSDKRITSCISGVSEGYELLLRTVFTSGILFLLTIGVTAAATS